MAAALCPTVPPVAGDARLYYYSNNGGAQQGPLELAGVQRMHSIGTITERTTIWYEGMAAWLPVPQVPELASALGIAPAAAAPAAAAPAASAGSAAAASDPRYTQESGFTVFTDPKGDKFVWDDARQDWLPYEQAMYMLRDADGTVAEAAAAPKAEELEAKLEATRPLDEIGQDMAAKAEIEEKIKLKEAKKKGQGAAAGGGGRPAAPAKVDLEAAKAAFAQDTRERFVAAQTFEGDRSGYVFKAGESGVGYYLDVLRVGAESLKRPGEELTEAERRKRNKKKTEWRKQKKASGWHTAKINTNVFASGLAPDTTVERLGEYFSKCGLVRRDNLTDEPCVKLYKDEQGNFKGEGLVSYEKEESVALAIEMLDGDQIMWPGHTLSVSRATFTQKGAAYIAKQKVQLSEEERKRLVLKKKEQASKLSWNEGDGEGAGMRIVVLKQVFHPDDARAAYNFYEELYEELEATMMKIGEVEKITIFQNNPDGVVSVRFKEGGAAEMAIETLHRSKMAGREVTCEYFDGITDYRVKETAEVAKAREEDFGDWLEQDSNPDKI